MMEGLCYYRPYVDPEFESLIERINPPRVCIDNDSSKDCTLVKVDSVKRHGILLEVVQILADLDLLISKSYISSDGGWFMDVFHVTDKFGNKITDQDLIHYIQQAVCTRRNSKEALLYSEPEVISSKHVAMEHMVLEITVADQPGLLSEVLAVLAELGCHVAAAVAWTHNHRAACILFVDDQEGGRPITDKKRQSYIQEQLQTVVEAHHKNGEKCSVRLTAPAPLQTHVERRLHQLMLADEDYKTCECCGRSIEGVGHSHKQHNVIGNGHTDSMSCECIHVLIENCKERGYSVVNIGCRDRPKLLFDTVCALTDMHFIVFHAAITSKGSIAVQEYYVRRKDGCTLDTENEKQRVTQCLIAAVKRRASQGLRLDITANDRLGLLADVTRVFREYGLSVSRAEISTRGDKATGMFCVTDASGRKISRDTLEAVKREIDGTVQVYDTSPSGLTSSSSSMIGQNRSRSSEVDHRPSFLSLGSLLWSRFERISSNLGPTKL